MEENISNYQGINGVNIKSNKGSHSLTASVETMAFLMVTSVPLVNNSTNFINPISPKQQIIKNIRRKSDVSMSNNKNTSTQEVRQKDLDNLEKIVDGHFDTLKVDLNRVEQNEQTHFDFLSEKINDVKTSVEKIDKNANEMKIAKLSFKAKIWVAVLTALGSIIGAALTGFIAKWFIH